MPLDNGKKAQPTKKNMPGMVKKGGQTSGCLYHTVMPLHKGNKVQPGEQKIFHYCSVLIPLGENV